MTTIMTRKLSEATTRTLRDFERDMTSGGRSERTVQSYLETVRQFAGDRRDAATFDVVNATREDVQGYMIRLEKKLKRSLATRQLRYRSLRVFFNWAIREELIDVSPMARMEIPTGAAKVRKIARLDDVRKIIAAIEAEKRTLKNARIPAHDRRRRLYECHRDIAIFKMFCESGAPRLGEMAGLRVADVDLDTDQVTVNGKTGERVFPIAPTTARAVSRFLRVRDGHKLAQAGHPGMWLGERGCALRENGIAQMVKRRCQQAGVDPIHPHRMRHMMAHLHLENGGSEQDLARLFGHVNTQMASVYAAETGVERAKNAATARKIGDLL